MFGLFKKDPIKELEKSYKETLEKAFEAQRNGKMDVFAKLSTEADNILKKINELEQNNAKS